MKIKNLFIMLAFTLIIMFVGEIRVEAEETENIYTIDFFLHVTYNGSYYSGYKCTGTVAMVNKQLVGYITDTSDSYGEVYRFNFYSYNSEGYSKYSCSSFSSDGTGIYEYGKCYEGGIWDYGTNYVNDSFNYHTGEGLLFPIVNNKYVNNSWEYLNTNIPIFASQEEAVAFINGEITERDAINYESDIAKIAYDLETPQNITVEGNESDSFSVEDLFINDIEVPELRFKWTQTDENYINWKTEVYVYENFKYRNVFMGLVKSDWENVDDYFLFEDVVDTYKLSWSGFYKNLGSAWEQRGKDYYTSNSTDYEVITESFYFRNYYYDSSTGIRHYSNWVKVEYDWSTGKVRVSYVELEGSEVEVDGDGNVSKPSGDVVPDSQYTGEWTDGTLSSSSTDIVGWVSDGFGFLGDNGIIQMMSDAFSFLPDFVWVIIGTGLGLFVLIAAVKLVF